MSSLIASKVDFIYRAKQREDDVLALKNINLEVQEESFVVAIGASGCGKTTLLNMFAGFLNPTSGEIFYGAADKAGGKKKQSATDSGAKEITGPGSDRGVVFQRHALLPWLNVIDNVSFGLKLQGVSKQEREKVSMKYLNLVGLEDFVTSNIYELSGGMQQRVGIARSLTSDPSTLLMDEPLGALDALTRENTQELILDIWQKTSKKIFFITHSVEEAIFMATHLIVMSPRPGRITHTFELDFGKRYLKVRDARKIKSLPEFIKVREQILEIIYSDEKNS